MSHLALTEMIGEKNVDWMEPLTDARYHEGPLITE